MTERFELVVLDASGSVHRFRRDFNSAEEALDWATGEGLVVAECRAARGDALASHWFVLATRWRRSSVDFVSFTHDLAVLADAGVTVKSALDVLTQRARTSAERQFLEQLRRDVSTGLPLSDALRRTGRSPQILVATVSASERTGDLGAGLLRYASHQEGLRAIRDRVVGACVYPMLLLFVGSLVLALLLGVVVPRFASLVDMNGRDLPWMSRQLMDWGRWASANSTAALALGASCALAVAWALWRLRDPALRRRWLARLPMVASLARDFQHLQMYRTAAILTSRGIPVQKALSMSCELLSDSDRARLEQAVLRMQEGASVSDALSSCGISDVVAASMLNVAEKTGAMPTMLDRIADFYEQSLRRNIEIVSRLIEPAMMIGFGIVIGGIVILMYLPIFDLASSIS